MFFMVGNHGNQSKLIVGWRNSDLSISTNINAIAISRARETVCGGSLIIVSIRHTDHHALRSWTSFTKSVVSAFLGDIAS